jgi:hypothetical protein
MNKIYRILTIIVLVFGTAGFVNAAIWYSSSGAIGSTAKWWSAPDSATLPHPSNFTTPGDSFVIMTGCYCTGNANFGAGTAINILGSWSSAQGYVGNITISAGGLLYIVSNLYVRNNYSNNGTYAILTGTNRNIIFNGIDDQRIYTGGTGAGKKIQWIAITKTSGTAILNGNLEVTYLFHITSGTFNAAGYDMYINNQFINNGVFLHGNNTIYFNSTIGANISTNGTGYGKCFYNVVTDKSTTSVLFKGISEIANNLTIASGYFQIQTNDVLYVGGNFINNGLYYTDVNKGTLILNGAGNQNITTNGTTSYKRLWNVTINKSTGTAYLIGDMFILNDFNIVAGSFDVNGYNMYVRNNWSNSGTFVPGTKTVTFYANNNTSTINGGGNGAGKAFYNVTFDHNTFKKKLNGDMSVTNTLLISNGCLCGGTGNYNIYCYGNVTVNDSFQPDNSTVHLMNGNAQTINMNRAFIRKFWNLTVNKTAATTASLAASIDVLNNLTLTSGILDVTASNYSIYVGGNWINNGGSLNARTATVFFNNAASANISGTDSSTFYNMTVDNTAPLIVNKNTRVTNLLTINSGCFLEVGPTATLNVTGTLTNNNATDNNLILRANSSGYGSLLTSNTSLHATAECYVSGGAIGSIPAKKHYVSPLVSGLYGSTLLDATRGNYNVYNLLLGAYNRILTGTPLIDGGGYLVSYNSDRVISYAGILNNSTINTTIDNRFLAPTCWTLVGNPYPAAIKCSLFMANATNSANIYGTLYFWSQSATNNSGDWAYWNASGSTGSVNTPGKVPNGFIAPGQGFMVASLAAGNSVQFTTSMKQSSTNNQFFIVDPDPVSRFYLNVKNPEGADNEILIAFSQFATKGFDNNYDAWKLRGNPELALYSMMFDDKRDYAIQGLPPVTDREIIAIGLDAGIAGNYTFNLGKLENFDPDVDIFLKDLKEKKTIDLKQTGSYDFLTEAGEIRDRFIIVFKNRNAAIESPLKNNEEIYIYASDHTIHLTKTDIDYLKGDLLISDLMGRNVYTGKVNGLQNYNLTLDQPAGFYIVQLKDGEKVWMKKVWVE